MMLVSLLRRYYQLGVDLRECTLYYIFLRDGGYTWINLLSVITYLNPIPFLYFPPVKYTITFIPILCMVHIPYHLQAAYDDVEVLKNLISLRESFLCPFYLKRHPKFFIEMVGVLDIPAICYDWLIASVKFLVVCYLTNLESVTNMKYEISFGFCR